MPMRSFDEIIKDGPSVGDVHISSATRRRRAQMPLVMFGDTAKAHGQTGAFAISVPIVKVNDELRTVYGWASVNTEKGSIVTDHQDDQVDDAEIIKAAHDFMTNSRVGGLLHARRAGDGRAHQGGDIVESVVFSPDVQKALGIDLGKTGWFIGYRVDDPDAWALVKSGTLKAFSIGGKAQRVPL